MAEFKEELVINALHTDKAVIGRRYWFADNINELKKLVETDSPLWRKLKYVHRDNDTFVYLGSYDTPFAYNLIYPYKEPPKQRMTYRQLAEWLAKGNGQYTTGGPIYHNIAYNSRDNVDEHTLEGYYKIRTWDSEEWIEPTVDIYERDCK